MIPHNPIPTIKKPIKRLHQSQYLPGAIKGRGQSIVGYFDVITTSTATLSNGEQAINQLLTTANNKETMLVTVERNIYIGSVLLNNVLPGGSAIDESQWQVIGDFNSVIKFDNTVPEKYENANWIYVRNISAGASQTVIFHTRAKYIINYANPLSTTGVSSA